MIRIVIPAHNEEARIGKTIAEYDRYFGDRVNFCVVANGCTDQTVPLVRSIMSSMKNLNLVEIPFAVGKGGAVRIGLMSGTEDLVGFTDADSSTPPESFDRLIGAFKSANVDAAIGSRWLPGSLVVSKQSLLRRVASRGFNLFARAFFGLQFADTQCGCKVFTRQSILKALPLLELSNFAFDLDVLYTYKKLEFKIAEVPIEWSDSAGSKVRIARIWFELFSGLMRLRLRTGIFKNIPYLDLLARSSVIGFKKHFRILVLNYDSPSDLDLHLKATTFAAAARDNGHDVKIVEARSFIQRLSFFAWYFSAANSVYDVIVDLSTNLPAWFTVLSSKPRVGPEILASQNVGRSLMSLPYYFGRSQFFFNEATKAWNLVGGNPPQTVEVHEVNALLTTK